MANQAPTRPATAQPAAPAARTVAVPGTAAPAAPKPPPFQMHALVGYERWLKALFYGDYGTGKTRLAGTAVLIPEMRDVFVIDAEAGDLTIASDPDLAVFRDHFMVVKVRDFRTYARVQEFLKLHCFYRDQGTAESEEQLKKLEKQLMPAEAYDEDAPAKKFYTCITDTLSEVESYSMAQLAGITDRSRIDDQIGQPEWAEFRQNHTQILRAIRAYRDLPMHVIFTCAAAYVQDEQKRQLWAPMLTGKLSRQCQGFMDIVGYLYVTPGEGNSKVHNLLCQPTPKINAKCRFSNFKSTGWQNPTIATIMDSVGLIKSGLVGSGFKPNAPLEAQVSAEPPATVKPPVAGAAATTTTTTGK